MYTSGCPHWHALTLMTDIIPMVSQLHINGFRPLDEQYQLDEDQQFTKTGAVHQFGCTSSHDKAKNLWSDDQISNIILIS